MNMLSIDSRFAEITTRSDRYTSMEESIRVVFRKLGFLEPKLTVRSRRSTDVPGYVVGDITVTTTVLLHSAVVAVIDPTFSLASSLLAWL